MTGYKYLFCAMLLLAVCSLSVLAQNATNILSGVVRDQNGDVIAGAQVKVLNITTAQTRESITGNDGEFTVPVLPPGNYSVTLFRDGFAPVEITGITLGTREERAFRVELKVGTVREQVTVQAHAVTVSPDMPALTTTTGRAFAEKLPLNGNSLQPIINLAPGVALSSAGNATPGLFSVNGQRPDANYFTVDGVSANIGVGYSDGTGLFSGDGDFPLGDRPPLTFLNGTQSLIASEAVESVQVQTSNYSAQFGRQPGAQVAFTSRAGSNQFNGSLFGNFRHRALETNDELAFFGLDNRIARYQQLGATWSGPLVKQRTFFFLTYEGLSFEPALPFRLNAQRAAALIRRAALGSIWRALVVLKLTHKIPG